MTTGGASIKEAAQFIYRQGEFTPSDLQREFRLNYSQAVRLLKALEAEGYAEINHKPGTWHSLGKAAEEKP